MTVSLGKPLRECQLEHGKFDFYTDSPVLASLETNTIRTIAYLIEFYFNVVANFAV
jgi:hypothetical protein